VSTTAAGVERPFTTRWWNTFQYEFRIYKLIGKLIGRSTRHKRGRRWTPVYRALMDRVPPRVQSFRTYIGKLADQRAVNAAGVECPFTARWWITFQYEFRIYIGKLADQRRVNATRQEKRPLNALSVYAELNPH
jgi:hypothetical protein